MSNIPIDSVDELLHALDDQGYRLALERVLAHFGVDDGHLEL